MREASGEEINWDRLRSQAEFAEEIRKAGENPKNRKKTHGQILEEHLEKKFPGAPARRKGQ